MSTKVVTHQGGDRQQQNQQGEIGVNHSVNNQDRKPPRSSDVDFNTSSSTTLEVRPRNSASGLRIERCRKGCEYQVFDVIRHDMLPTRESQPGPGRS